MCEFALFVYHIFAKIPGRGLFVPAILSRIGEPFVERRLGIAFDGYFFKHRESDTVILLAESTDHIGRTRFLRAEIVAREA